MPRQPREYRDIHRAADTFEPRLERAFRKAVARMQARVTVEQIALALESGSQRRVMALFPLSGIKDAFAPLGGIVRDASKRGGRLGAAEVRRDAE